MPAFEQLNLGQYPESPQEHLDGLRQQFDRCAARLGVVAAETFVANPAYADQLEQGFEKTGFMDKGTLADAFDDVVTTFKHDFLNQPASENPEIPALIEATNQSGNALSEALLSGDYFTGELKELFLEQQAEYTQRNRLDLPAYDAGRFYDYALIGFAERFANDNAAGSVVASFSNVFDRVANAHARIQKIAPTDKVKAAQLLKQLAPFALETSRISQAQLTALGYEPLEGFIGRNADNTATIGSGRLDWPEIQHDVRESANYYPERDQIFNIQGCPAGNHRLIAGTGHPETAIEVLWPWVAEAVAQNLA